MTKLALIGLGGFIGANLRYLISVALAQLLGTGFPYGTLAVNGIGSFVLGLVMALSQLLPFGTELRLFVGTGMMGALTTFSTFSYETLEMLRTANYGLAASNILLNLSISFVAVWLGWTVARLWR